MGNHVVASGNFLVPDATFIAELIAFLIILGILGKYVLPPIQKAMRERQELIRKQVEDSEEAKTKLAEAERAYQNALNGARPEPPQTRETPGPGPQGPVEELRSQAQEE